MPLLNGVKSRGSVVEKNRKGAIFLRRPTRAIDSRSWKVFPRLLSCPTFVNCVLTAQRSKKVEFSARRVGTNGLNSLQLSLDKLKTNTCSPSKHPVTRSVSFFPKESRDNKTLICQIKFFISRQNVLCAHTSNDKMIIALLESKQRQLAISLSSQTQWPATLGGEEPLFC